MIQANELRIGNYINVTHVHFNETEISTIQIDDILRIVTNIPTYDYKPIPITKVWLFKLGVEYNKTWDRFTVFENDAFSLYASFDDINGFQIWFENAFAESTININYVHQLQNLYFSLTGKDLNYNIYGMPLKVDHDVI